EPIRAKLIPALTEIEKVVKLGFLKFPAVGSTPDPSCCVASDLLVKPALGAATAIDRQLTCNPRVAPCDPPGPSCTPTDDALAKAQELWKDPEKDADRFVLVVTDGAPNCDG